MKLYPVDCKSRRRRKRTSTGRGGGRAEMGAIENAVIGVDTGVVAAAGKDMETEG